MNEYIDNVNLKEERELNYYSISADRDRYGKLLKKRLSKTPYSLEHDEEDIIYL
jgi:hypothetical protein